MELNNVDEQIREDLGGLVRKIEQHGLASEEVRDYVNETAESYQQGSTRREYLELAATLIYLHDREK